MRVNETEKEIGNKNCIMTLDSWPLGVTLTVSKFSFFVVAVLVLKRPLA